MYKLFHLIKQHLLFNFQRPITLAKKKGMIDLLPYIPSVHDAFFNYLSNKISKDLEGVEPLINEKDISKTQSKIFLK